MPILGVVASSTRQGQVATDTGAMFPLQSITVGSAGASSVTFASIPATYAHLQIRIFYKNSAGGSTFMTLNSTSATKGHYLYTEGTTVSSGVSGTNFIANASSSYFGVAIVDILDYTNTNKYVTVRNLAGWDGNGSGQIALNSQFYNLSATAVNSMTFTPTSGNFDAYTQFALYGVKSA